MSKINAPQGQNRTGPVVLALLFLLTSVIMLISSFADPSHTGRIRHDIGPNIYPRILLVLMALLSVVVIIQEFKLPSKPVSYKGWLRVFSMVVITTLYIAAIPAIGFVLATIPYLILVPLLAGYRRYGVIISVSLIYTVGVWLLFERVLFIILPQSPWFSF